jgi:hypothetical protein
MAPDADRDADYDAAARRFDDAFAAVARELSARLNEGQSPAWLAAGFAAAFAIELARDRGRRINL